MVSKETNRIISPTERYSQTIAEFEERRRAVLATPPVQIPTATPQTLWQRITGEQRAVPEPVVSSSEEQLAGLEAEFCSWLHSDRQMVICHLNANPGRKGEIMANYLQSSELLKDANTWGAFLEFWFQEFFQRFNTGPIENLIEYIKATDVNTLPRDLRRAKANAFDPLFKLWNGKEKEIFGEVGSLGLFSASRNLAEETINSGKPFSSPLLREYQSHVTQLIKLEAGLVEPRPSESEKRLPTAQKPHPEPKEPPPSEAPTVPSSKIEYSYFMVPGQNTPPTPVTSLDDLAHAMKAINGLGPITPRAIWSRLAGLSKMTPLEMMKRYGERVAGGPFEGWQKIPIGRMWCILLRVEDHKVFFRMGPHEKVYGTGRRKPHDRARRL